MTSVDDYRLRRSLDTEKQRPRPSSQFNDPDFVKSTSKSRLDIEDKERYGSNNNNMNDHLNNYKIQRTPYQSGNQSSSDKSSFYFPPIANNNTSNRNSIDASAPRRNSSITREQPYEQSRPRNLSQYQTAPRAVDNSRSPSPYHFSENSAKYKDQIAQEEQQIFQQLEQIRVKINGSSSKKPTAPLYSSDQKSTYVRAPSRSQQQPQYQRQVMPTKLNSLDNNYYQNDDITGTGNRNQPSNNYNYPINSPPPKSYYQTQPNDQYNNNSTNKTLPARRLRTPVDQSYTEKKNPNAREDPNMITFKGNLQQYPLDGTMPIVPQNPKNEPQNRNTNSYNPNQPYQNPNQPYQSPNQPSNNYNSNPNNGSYNNQPNNGSYNNYPNNNGSYNNYPNNSSNTNTNTKPSGPSSAKPTEPTDKELASSPPHIKSYESPRPPPVVHTDITDEQARKLEEQKRSLVNLNAKKQVEATSSPRQPIYPETSAKPVLSPVKGAPATNNQQKDYDADQLQNGDERAFPRNPSTTNYSPTRTQPSTYVNNPYADKSQLPYTTNPNYQQQDRYQQPSQNQYPSSSNNQPRQQQNYPTWEQPNTRDYSRDTNNNYSTGSQNNYPNSNQNVSSPYQPNNYSNSSYQNRPQNNYDTNNSSNTGNRSTQQLPNGRNTIDKLNILQDYVKNTPSNSYSSTQQQQRY